MGKGVDSALAESLKPQQSFELEVDDVEQRDLGGEVIAIKGKAPSLNDKFVVPPFTTLDTRQGYWKQRRDQWLGLGLRSETGRKEGLMMNSGVNGDPQFYTRKAEVEKRLGRTITTEEFRKEHYDREKEMEGQSGSLKTGTSVFDPLLCEIIYRWFSKPGLFVLDPFAGGAVRGVVAGALGRNYCGVELRPEQIEDNERQAVEILLQGKFNFGRKPSTPVWVEGDATALRALDLPKANLVFTCPPYSHLEVYSDDPRDLSTAPYETFRTMLASAMAQSADLLVDNGFSIWVVGEVRGKDGISYGLPHDTVTAARRAGLGLYNEGILVGSVGTAMLRAAKHVNASRKLERCHQHIYVFVKGDPKKAAIACGNAEVEA